MMRNSTDACTACGHVTNEWKKKHADTMRLNPIYGTNLQRPLSEIVKELRERMTALRGGFTDFQFAYPGWRERTEPVEGLLTCGISTLWNVLQELEKFERETEGSNVEMTGQQQLAAKPLPDVVDPSRLPG